MIHHELFGQHLRLGNFAWQIAATIKLCSTYNADTIYPDYYLWKYLKNPPKIYPSNIPEGFEIIRPRVWEWTANEEVWLNSLGEKFRNEDVSLALNFFFQSYKWFEGVEDKVYDFFQFKDDYVQFVKEKYAQIFIKKPTIGISLRLGDFKGHGDFYQIPKEYYLKALEVHFPNWEDYNIVIFSDHIEEAKTIFKDVYFAEPNGTHTHAENFKYYHSEKAIEQFVLGALMDNFIIGNSTFSWWQAWIATYKYNFKNIKIAGDANFREFEIGDAKGIFDGTTNAINAFEGKTQSGITIDQLKGETHIKGKVVHSGKVFSQYGNMKHCDTSHFYCPHWDTLDINDLSLTTTKRLLL